MANKKTAPLDFEASLANLSQLVEKMEQGNLALETSLQYFEQGIGIIRDCQQALANAKQKVEILTQKGNASLEPFIESEDV